MSNQVNEVAVIDVMNNPVRLFTGTDISVDEFLRQARESATKEVFDVNTPKGRKQIRSKANDVAKTKVALDKAGKNLVSEWKEKAKSIDAERKKIRDSFDQLKADVRKPLTEWEDEQERIKKEKELKIQTINNLLICDTNSSDEVQGKINDLSFISSDDEDIKELITRTREQLNARKIIALDAERKAEEARIAEQKRIEKEAKRKEEEERDARIKREAEIAENARLEAEKKAEKDRLEQEARQNELIEKANKQAEDARIEAELSKRKAEEEEKARLVQMEADKARYEKEKADAIQAEKDRQSAEQDRIEKEKKAREQDLEHRRGVNNKILQSLTKCGLSDNQAKTVITKIASGSIPNVILNY